MDVKKEVKIETAVFGNGCFWCTEAVFSMLKGVKSVSPGYAGGYMKNPTYERVSGGNTGHAESIKIEYDSTVISYDDLLAVFFNTHDPTTLNRQGNDVGTQYRDYYLNHPDQPYCQLIIAPKLEKLQKRFSNLIRNAE